MMARQRGNRGGGDRNTTWVTFPDLPRTEGMSALLSRTDILKSDAKAGNEGGPT
jgi:hypothetical protein